MNARYLITDLDHKATGLRRAYLDQPAATSVQEKGIILLLHGFPQTSYQFRHVLPLLSNAGFRCIAPDYRGAGRSSKPSHDFRKTTMAADMVALLDLLNINEEVHVVGHDIGGVVAFAMASRLEGYVRSVCWGECPLPGTTKYRSDRTDNAVQQFHFIFHSVPDLPEALVAGREKVYVTHFLTKICHNLDALPEEAIEHYTKAYAQPGVMKCAFNVYRAFEEDARENEAWIPKHGKCVVPPMVLSGSESRLSEDAEAMVLEVTRGDFVTVGLVPDASHYLAEENPQGFADVVLSFIMKHM